MDFQSPRFAGEPTLTDILNDPNTGTKKLQAGSPSEAVLPVQRALFDLGWTIRIAPPVQDDSQFVIGTYGPITTKTVLAYKTHYGLRFPPGDPDGFLDGLTGPTTLAHLDRRIVLYDEAVVSVEAKAAELRAAGTDVQVVELSPRLIAILDTDGAFCPTSGPFEAAGGIWTEPSIGTFWVVRQTASKYLEMGHAHSPLGFPITDTHFDDPDLRVERSDFQHGAITYDIATDEVSVITAA